MEGEGVEDTEEVQPGDGEEEEDIQGRGGRQGRRRDGVGTIRRRGREKKMKMRKWTKKKMRWRKKQEWFGSGGYEGRK